MSLRKETPCDFGECPYVASYSNTCEFYCSCEESEDRPDEEVNPFEETAPEETRIMEEEIAAMDIKDLRVTLIRFIWEELVHLSKEYNHLEYEKLFSCVSSYNYLHPSYQIYMEEDFLSDNVKRVYLEDDYIDFTE